MSAQAAASNTDTHHEPAALDTSSVGSVLTLSGSSRSHASSAAKWPLALANSLLRRLGLRGALPPSFYAASKNPGGGRFSNEFATSALSLERALEQLDRDFLQTGVGLEKLQELSSGLVDQSRLLLKMAVGQEGAESIFEDAATVLFKPLEFADSISGEWPVMLSEIQRVVGSISLLKDLRYRLDRTVAPLDVLQRMFRIECSSLSTETQALFATLTAGMQDVRIEMFGMIESKFTFLESSVTALNEIEAQLHVMVGKAEAAKADRIRIRENLDRTREQLTMDLSKDVALSGVTDAIQQQVATVIMSLQTQDLVNQRVRHILDLLKKCTTTSNSGVVSRDAAIVARAQLQAAGRELAEAKQTILHGLNAILSLTQELDREVLHLTGIDLSSTADGGLVQTLLESSEQARNSLHSMSEDSRRVFQTLTPIQGLVGNLSTDMASIAQRMRLIAINTQIQSAHAGQGTGLDVLATRTSAISDETARITTEMSGSLADLKCCLDGVLSRINEIAGNAHEESVALDQKSAREEQILHAFRDKSLSTLAILDILGADTQNQVQQLCKTVSETADLDSAGAQIQFLLQKIAETASPASEDAIHDPALLQEFRGLYSMASERVLHDSLLGGSSAGLSSESTPNLSQEQDVRGNIDFF